MDFNKLKQNRASAMDKLVQASESNEVKKSNSYGDDRIWKPTRDKAGNGYAVIRFLPQANDGLPWTKYFSHGFQGPTGKWYIEWSRTSIEGEQDPVSELNSELWNNGDKDAARKQKRRLHYVANILVESDPANPENEGKVFLYQFGKKIFEKIQDSMQPEFADETPVNPFDLWEGASFKLKIRKVEGFVNYDKSEFGNSSPLLGGDEEQLEALFAKTYALAEFTDPNSYKSYEELKTKMNRVLGITAAGPVVEATITAAPTPVEAPSIEDVFLTVEPTVADSDDADDSTMSYFAKLAQDD